MQEFSSISVSSYEAGSLAERLTEQSRDGWVVVAIVPTGSTITAYLAREAAGGTTADAAAADAPEPVEEPAHEPAGDGVDDLAAVAAAAAVTDLTPEPAEEPAAEPAAEPVLPTSTSIMPEAATPVAAAAIPDEIAPSTAEPAAEPAAAAATAAGAAPAGWYADPSGRFELRYWDGGQWTEHVSRAGQQYTDPPIA